MEPSLSIPSALAEAVLQVLRAGAYCMPFTPRRAYRPQFQLNELSTLQVSVVPRSLESQSATRSKNAFDVAIDVAVQKKFASRAESAVIGEADQLLRLVQEIADSLRLVMLEGVAQWVKTTNDPIYLPEHFDQLGVFTSVLTVTYRILR